MSADGEDPPVGYKRPPKRHQFRKGQTGNPRGRPRKNPKSAKVTAASDIIEIILAEAQRSIAVREGDKTVQMPMAQAVLRSMGMAALKGSHRAGAQFLALTKAAEESQAEFDQKLRSSYDEMKIEWAERCVRSVRSGVSLPAPVPHPDDFLWVDSVNCPQVIGPIDEIERETEHLLDTIHCLAEDRLKRIRLVATSSANAHLYRWELAGGEALVRRMALAYPKDHERRAADFDLERWLHKAERTKGDPPQLVCFDATRQRLAELGEPPIGSPLSASALATGVSGPAQSGPDFLRICEMWVRTVDLGKFWLFRFVPPA